MKFLSVCSGIEAASVAWNPLGWEAVAFSEIEPFPCAVLAHHYPDTPNWGDMTKFKEWPDVSIDLLCGGTPCQSFSVAGLRAGLADPRGNLMLTYLAIAAKYRPQWVVWENVPGVHSSWSGDDAPSDLEPGERREATETSDFGSFLAGLAELGYGFAYRIFDAQYFGVAQRRRRVFVVGCLGDWRSAAAVLFERHSLQGHPAPSREAGKGTSHSLEPSLTASGRGVERCGETRGQDPVVAVSPTLRAGGNKTGGDRPPGTDVDTCETLIPVRTLCVATGQAGAEMAPTLNCNHEAPYIAHSLRGEGFDASEDGTGRGTPLVPVLAFDCKASGQNGFGIGEIASTQRAMGHANSHTNGGGHQAAMVGMQVRRLTPRECERLQGFPSIHEVVRINVCFDHQNGSADVALSCLRWPSNASRADAERFPQSAPSAGAALSTNQAHREPLAVLRAHLGFEADLLELHSHGRSIWPASSVGASSSFPLSMPPGNIAAAVAKPSQCLGLAMRAGKVESHQSIRLSIPGQHGAQSAPMFGDGSAESASDAMSAARLERFTTSDLGQLAPSSASQTATWLCSVLAAISGCIPSETLPDSFSFEIDVEADYTAVPHRGNPAADGPRYKALGNSWAVPNVHWIGKRIDAVNTINALRKAA